MAVPLGSCTVSSSISSSLPCSTSSTVKKSLKMNVDLAGVGIQDAAKFMSVKDLDAVVRAGHTFNQMLGSRYQFLSCMKYYTINYYEFRDLEVIAEKGTRQTGNKHRGVYWWIIWILNHYDKKKGIFYVNEHRIVDAVYEYAVVNKEKFAELLWKLTRPEVREARYQRCDVDEYNIKKERLAVSLCLKRLGSEDNTSMTMLLQDVYYQNVSEQELTLFECKLVPEHAHGCKPWHVVRGCIRRMLNAPGFMQDFVRLYTTTPEYIKYVSQDGWKPRYVFPRQGHRQTLQIAPLENMCHLMDYYFALTKLVSCIEFVTADVICYELYILYRTVYSNKPTKAFINHQQAIVVLSLVIPWVFSIVQLLNIWISDTSNKCKI